MREIKFRGKRVDNGEWEYGFYGVKGEGTEYEEHFIIVDTFNANTRGYPFFFDDVKVYPETVGQYTGLYAGVFNSLCCGDKEYDEIYEGDKISVTYATQGMSNSHEHTITGVVAFKNGSFVVEWDFPKKGKYKYRTLNSVKTLGDCGVVIKIIGNIHDNPELVEVTE